MCRRFSLTADLDEFARLFEFEGNRLELTRNYNVAPAHNVFTVINDGENRRGGFMRWSRIPHWTKTPSIASQLTLTHVRRADRPLTHRPTNNSIEKKQ